MSKKQDEINTAMVGWIIIIIVTVILILSGVY